MSDIIHTFAQELKSDNIMISGRYYIADCEHNGDIDRAANFVKRLGGKVISQYWDGFDCGDAYIEIEVPVEVFKRCYNHPSFSFEANIYDYVEKPKLTTNHNDVSAETYEQIKDEYRADLNYNFQNRLTANILICDALPSRGDMIIDKLAKELNGKVVATKAKPSISNVDCVTYTTLITFSDINTFHYVRRSLKNWFVETIFMDINHIISSFSDRQKAIDWFIERKPLKFSRNGKSINVGYDIYTQNGKYVGFQEGYGLMNYGDC